MRNNRWTCPAPGRAALAGTAALLLTACAGHAALKPSTWHLPWRKPPVAAPESVNELPVQSDSDTPVTVLQYWSRNTLRVDLSALGDSGTLKLLPSPVNGWPARLEFAVRPGSIAQLEVRGDQRAIYAVSAATSDGAPQTLPVSPSVYSPGTASITVSWN